MESNKATPNLGSFAAVNSPMIGTSMSASYQDEWLGAATPTEVSKLRRRSSQNIEDTRQRNLPKKPTTKAERRALQEKQRLEKKQKRALVTATTSKPASVQGPGSCTSNADKPVAATTGSARRNQQQQRSSPDQHKQQGSKNHKSILNHLELPKKPDTERNKDLHPAVLTLALLFSQYKIVGSNARCVAVLETFSQVIKDHIPPTDATFIRHIQKHLDSHIAFILRARSLSLSVRECIRWLKKQIADMVAVHPPIADTDARRILQEKIAHFIHERIIVADKLIVQNALTKIENGDVILTYSKSSVIERILLEAKKRNIDFQVIVVDSRPLLEGKHLMKNLRRAGIQCQYTLISSVYIALKSVTKVFMGVHAILNNGSSYARIGSAVVAMAANDRRVPVILCSETYKFVNHTQVDSLVMNEKGDPNCLASINDGQPTSSPSSPLANWKQQPCLSILNLMYDVTPSKYISVVITEIGIIPCTSAPVIWREFS